MLGARGVETLQTLQAAERSGPHQPHSSAQAQQQTDSQHAPVSRRGVQTPHSSMQKWLSCYIRRTKEDWEKREVPSGELVCLHARTTLGYPQQSIDQSKAACAGAATGQAAMQKARWHPHSYNRHNPCTGCADCAPAREALQWPAGIPFTSNPAALGRDDLNTVYTHFEGA